MRHSTMIHPQMTQITQIPIEFGAFLFFVRVFRVIRGSIFSHVVKR